MSLRIVISWVAVGAVLCHVGPVCGGEPLKPASKTICHSGEIDIVAFSPDGKLLAVGGASKPLRPDTKETASDVAIWDVSARKQLTTLAGQTGPLSALAFSPDSKLLATSNEEGVKVWDVATGKEVAVLKGFPLGAIRLQFAPSGRVLAGISSGDNKKILNQVQLVDVASWKALATLDLGVESAHSLTFSPDGKTLAVGSGEFDSKTEVWKRGHVWVCDPDGTALKKKLEIPQSKVTALAFSPDGKALAIGSNPAPPWGFRTRAGMGDGVVTLWDVATWKERARSEKSVAPVESLTFTADGKGLVYVTGTISQKDHPTAFVTVLWGELFLLDGSNLKPLIPKPLHTSYWVRTNQYSPKAGLLVTGVASEGDRLKLWELDLER